MAQTIEVGNFYMALLGNYHVAATHHTRPVFSNQHMSPKRK